MADENNTPTPESESQPDQSATTSTIPQAPNTSALRQWASDQDFASIQVAELCSEMPDPRVAILVAALASGKTGKVAGDLAGINRVQYWRICKRFPVHKLAAMEAEYRARAGLMKLSAKMTRAAEVVCDAIDGNVDAENMEVEKHKLNAAKVAIGTMIRVLEKTAEQAEGKRPSRAREIGTAELLARAMQIRAGSTQIVPSQPDARVAVIEVPASDDASNRDD